MILKRDKQQQKQYV